MEGTIKAIEGVKDCTLKEKAFLQMVLANECPPGQWIDGITPWMLSQVDQPIFPWALMQVPLVDMMTFPSNGAHEALPQLEPHFDQLRLLPLQELEDLESQVKKYDGFDGKFHRSVVDAISFLKSELL